MSCSLPCVATALPPCGPAGAVEAGERPAGRRTRTSNDWPVFAAQLHRQGDIRDDDVAAALGLSADPDTAAIEFGHGQS